MGSKHDVADAYTRVASRHQMAVVVAQLAEYLNVPPTELARRVKHEKDPGKRRKMQNALDAWRTTSGNPLAPETTKVAAEGWFPDGDGYNGNPPREVVFDLLDLVDLTYREEWDRAATPEEVAAVLRSVASDVEVGADTRTWPRNLWVDAVTEAFEVPNYVVLSLSTEEQDDLASLWERYTVAETFASSPPETQQDTARREGTPPNPSVALENFLDAADRALDRMLDSAEDLVEEDPPADPLRREAGRNYLRLVMFDFDGTLFNSSEGAPSWWSRPGAYSWGVDPASLEPPCVPARPGGAYWNSGVVQAARDASHNSQTFTVLITGRVKALEPRIRELLSQQGIVPDALFFNPNMNAASFKKRIFGALMIRFPYIQALDIWENENQDVYKAFVEEFAERLGHDIALQVHHVREHAMPALCGPEDFQARVAASPSRGVGLFLPLPASLAAQFPHLSKDNTPPHVTLLYVGAVPASRKADFVSTVLSVLSVEQGPVRAELDQVDYFTHPEHDRRVWYARVRFSRDVARIRDRLRLALEDAGFPVADRSPLAYFPHVTLSYSDGIDSRYEGPVPSGSWSFNSVSVWGLPNAEPLEVMLGTMEPQRRLAEDRLPGGLGDTKKPADFDEEQLAKGVKVEMEHTDDPAIAREIAMDHLTEDSLYYDKLEEVEGR